MILCVVLFCRGHSGDGYLYLSILFKYDCRVGHLFVLSWTKVRRVALGGVVSERCTLSGMFL